MVQYLCFQFTSHALLFVCANEHMELVQILDDKRLAWSFVQREENLLYRGVTGKETCIRIIEDLKRPANTGIPRNEDTYHKISPSGSRVN